MSDPKELKQREQQLVRRAKALRAESAQLADELSDARAQRPGGDVADSGEQSESRARLEVRTEEQRRDALELADIDAALKRIADGRYGECVDCGRSIPAPRLQAQPAAARCIACQERREAQGATTSLPA